MCRTKKIITWTVKSLGSKKTERSKRNENRETKDENNEI